MLKSGWLVMTLASGLVVCGAAQAQDNSGLICERTRAEVRSECIDFMKTHRWDELTGQYVLKSTGKAVDTKTPEGVKSRKEIMAERDAFMRANRWNEASGQWEPVGPKPRELSQLSRDAVKKETAAFMKTHRWDEATAMYVERKAK